MRQNDCRNFVWREVFQACLSVYFLLCSEAMMILIQNFAANLPLLSAITRRDYQQYHSRQTFASIFQRNNKEYKLTKVHISLCAPELCCATFHCPVCRELSRVPCSCPLCPSGVLCASQLSCVPMVYPLRPSVVLCGRLLSCATPSCSLHVSVVPCACQLTLRPSVVLCAPHLSSVALGCLVRSLVVLFVAQWCCMHET